MKKRTTKKLPRLNDEQLYAVRDFACDAIAKGRTWRLDLIANWKDGQYPRDMEISDGVPIERKVELLNQIRDQYGPEWLMAYTFPAYMDIEGY